MAKYGLLIGNDKLNTNHYGSDYKLNAPENDVKNMMHLCKMEGINIHQPLINEIAASVVSHINYLNNECVSGDFLLIYFSGHGTQFPGKSGNEDDGFNESWCLYDRCLIDNEINRILSLFRSGVRILIISDSCHSGTVAELLPNSDTDVKVKSVPGVYNRNKEFYNTILLNNPEIEDINPSVILLSACQDDEEAREFDGHSEFTNALIDVWNHGNFTGRYDEFISKIASKVKGTKPNLSRYGYFDDRFYNSRPFKS